MADNTVLPNIAAVDEEKFHAAMMECLSRSIGRFGKARVAQVMCLSVRQLDNLGNGSFPRPDRLWNLLTLDPNALDPINRVYGQRNVPRKAICSTDPVSTKLARLLTHTIDMEHPASDGGHDATLGELLALDEDVLRASALKLNGWIEKIDAYRAGEKPRLKVAS